MQFFKKIFSRSLNLKLLEISIPQKERSEGQDIASEINLSEQLFSTLASLGEPFVFEVAVHNVGSTIHFYSAIPRGKVEYVTQQIQGLFPDAHIEEVNDYTVFAPTSNTSAGYVSPKESSILPIRTYEESKVDTFAPILSTLSKLNETGDGAALQIFARPVSSDFKKKVQSTIERVRKGEKLNAILKENILTEVGKFLGSDTPKKEELGKQIVVDEQAVQTLEKKISKPLFNIIVRAVVASEDHDRAEDLLMGIGGSFSQFSAPTRNELRFIKPKNQKNLIYEFIFRRFSDKQAFVANTEELASFFHLPTFSTVVPRIKWQKTKESAAPEELPQEGIILGDSNFRGERRPVRLMEEDRRRHVYMVGQTGTGKSTLIKYMAEQDIKGGKGVCIIDPNGDLIDDMLSVVPTERINDVIVFDPSDLDRPLGLNMLEYDFARPEQKTFIVNEMQSIFNRLFSEETMGPMFEQYMRNALLLLMEDAQNEPATLIEVPRVFTDTEYRKRKLARIKNPLVIDFWEKEAAKAGGDASLANITPYITSKFGNFISNDYMRPIIGQTTSAINFRKIMDEGKILLVKLPKGRIGDINANLLGMIITGRLLMAALGRGDISQEDRRDFYFYIDEFQNFTTDSISTILSEARKYRLNLTVAHQFIAQLREEIKDAVFGNVGTLVSFRIGTEDAEALERHFAPEFDMGNLISLENLNAVIRPLINGHPARAFNMKIRFPDKGSPEVREKLVELSKLTYGKQLSEVEKSILQRLRV
ncbi:hypothetical protein CL654_02695 [bacterium]|nr:hypothetical protein [bacterium]|tara:strand:+ start:28266 stop:30548 length:2283 start_codon:yes stop_codon:yes gene_type:complete